MSMTKTDRGLVEAVGQLWDYLVRDHTTEDGSTVTPERARGLLAELSDGELARVVNAALVLHRDYAERESALRFALLEIHQATIRLGEVFGYPDPRDCVREMDGWEVEEEIDDYRVATALNTCIEEYMSPTGRVWSPEEILYLMELEAAEAAGL